MNSSHSRLAWLLASVLSLSACGGSSDATPAASPATPQPPAPPAPSDACTAQSVRCVGWGQEYSAIQTAVDSAQPGDTVLVYDGNYPSFTVSRGGTTAQRLVIRAAASSARITQANAEGDGINIRVRDPATSSVDHLTIEGFTITDMPRYGLGTQGATPEKPLRGLVIRNNTVTGSGSTNIYVSEGADSLIEGNTTSGSKASHGIYLANASSDNTTLRGNRCFNNFKNGIHFNGDISIGGDGVHTGLLIDGNTLYNNNANGIDADGVQDSTFQNNLIFGNRYNAIRVFQIDAAAGAKGLRIINNTLLVPANGEWAIKLSEDAGGHVIFNNILWAEPSASGSLSVESARLTSNHNIVTDRFSIDGDNTTLSLSAWRLASQQDKQSSQSSTSALFANAGAADYRLKAGSPALNAGVAQLGGASTPALDISGTSRSSTTPDLGAYESP